MKSSKCLFNKAVFKSDLKRFLPFTIPLLLVNLIIFPIVIYSSFNIKNNPLTLESFTGMSVASDIFNFAFSGLFAILVFAYLYKANRCNAMHAFPIGRRGLFITNFVAGYILLVVPQLIAFLVSVPGIQATSKVFGQIVLLEIVSIFADSFIFYTSGVLAVMLAGNIFAAAVLYLIINFGEVALEAIIGVVVTRIGHGVTMINQSLFGFLGYSPLTEFVTLKAALAASGTDDIFFSEIYSEFNMSLDENYYKRLIVYLVFSLVIIAASYLLYKFRKLECAGDMVAFKVEIPIISILVSFVGGSLLSLFVGLFIPYEMLGYLVLYAIFSFVVFIVTQMILRKTARIFNLKNMLLWLISCAVIIAGLFLYATYQTNYVPKASRVEKMTVNCSYDIDLESREDIEKAEKLHKALIENEKKRKPAVDEESQGLWGFVFDSFPDDWDVDGYGVTVAYKLKNGGNVVRNYHFEDSVTEFKDMITELEKEHHPKSALEELNGMEYEITGAYAEGYGLTDADTYEYNIPSDRVDEVFEMCKKHSLSILENYSSFTDEYDGEEYYDDGTIYNMVTFTCKVKDEKSADVLTSTRFYYYDESGVRVNRDDYDYDYYMNWDYEEDDIPAQTHESGRFTIEFNSIPMDSEIIKSIKAQTDATAS